MGGNVPDVSKDIDELQARIDRLREDVAAVHGGERHLSDGNSADFEAALAESGETLEALHRQWEAEHAPPGGPRPHPEAGAATGDRLTALRIQIEEVRRDVARFHHEGEPHFSD